MQAAPVDDSASVVDELDAGPRGPRVRLRSCIVTREAQDPSALIRFVVGPDGAIVPDLKQILPGRGAWVTARRATLALAVKRKAFARAFRKPVAVSPGLADELGLLLRREALQGLSLANKAGAVLAGFGKVEAACAAGSVVALIHAREAGEDGIRKIGQALRRASEGAEPSITMIRDFAAEELDLALGRAHVIHAALVAGSGSGVFLSRWHRLAGYEAADASGPVDIGRIPADMDGRDGSEQSPGYTAE